MKYEDFDALVARLDNFASKYPRLFALRILAWVALAYGYLISLLLGMALACLGLVVLVFLVPGMAQIWCIGLVVFGGALFIAWHSLRVKLKPPIGRQLVREQAPKLFAVVDNLVGTLDCKPFRRVVLTWEHNAGVMDIPRQGMFGPTRSYLLLGLPLMLGLSPEEFRSVLAHELGHCSRRHSRFSNWVYRTRSTWGRIMTVLTQQRGPFAGFFVDFYVWFWPRFNAHAFVLSRANEYEADASAAEIVGAGMAACSLIRCGLNEVLLRDKFWPEVFDRANRESEPPDAIMLAMGKLLRVGSTPEEASVWLDRLLQVETNNLDTHPALHDRLKGMGCAAELPPPMEVCAAEFHLGEALLSTLAGQLSRDWQRSVASDWRRRYHQANWKLPARRNS